MKKALSIALTFMVIISACTPGSSPASSQTQTDAVSQSTVTQNPAEQTQLQPTATLLPTPEPTQPPVRFDRDGFRQFAVMHDSYDGLLNFIGDRSITEFSTALSPSGDRIAITACFGNVSNLAKCETSKSGFLVVLDNDTGKLLNEIPLGEGWAGKADFTSDGKNLLYATNEYKIALWDLTTNKPGLTLFAQPAPDTNYYPDVAAAPDGHSLAAVVDDTLYVWDPSGKLLFQAPAYKLMISGGLAYSADGSRLTVFSPGHTGVDVYDTNNWTLVRRIAFDKIQDVAISPDGQLVVAVNTVDETATVWSVESGEQVAHLDPGHWADSVQFNPAGDLLIVAGLGNLDTQDGYSSIGTLYDTQTWTKVDDLYSFSSDGRIEFNKDGSRMAIAGNSEHTIWALPDEKLQAGFEVVKQFQAALSTGDYAAAAALFEVIDGEKTYLTEIGIDVNDISGSFERLCKTPEVFCHPVSELVMMGYSWDTMTYLVRLQDPNGGVFTSPKGAHIIYFYVNTDADGNLRVSYPPVD